MSFSVSISHPGSLLALCCHVSFVPSTLWQFLRLFLPFMTFTLLKLMVWHIEQCSSIWVSLKSSCDLTKVMNFKGKNNRSDEVMSPSHCIMSGCVTSVWLITGFVNPDHLGKMGSASFLHCEVTISLFCVRCWSWHPAHTQGEGNWTPTLGWRNVKEFVYIS